MKIIEAVPNRSNALQKIDYYNKTSDPWLYVYRKDKNVADRMIKEANNMLNSDTRFIYENPSFGWRNWCCVTFVSYLATIATNGFWKMGSNQNAYIWSPRYGVGYDAALLDMGFIKYDFKSVQLQNGDIVQSWTHAGIVEDEMTTTQRYMLDAVEDTVLKLGMKEPTHLIKFIQAYLQYWGWYNGDIDGWYGDMTRMAVMGWQEHDKRTITGEIRKEDWQWIEENG